MVSGRLLVHKVFSFAAVVGRIDSPTGDGRQTTDDGWGRSMKLNLCVTVNPTSATPYANANAENDSMSQNERHHRASEQALRVDPSFKPPSLANIPRLPRSRSEFGVSGAFVVAVAVADNLGF